MRHKNIFIFAVCYLVLVLLIGCDAFVRKFTRKPTKEKPPEEMVLVPEEYSSLFKTKEEAYRQYFLYWQSWQDELINALLSKLSHKKQLSCIDEAIKNLTEVRNLLAEEKQKALDPYLERLTALRGAIEEDTYSNNTDNNRYKAEVLKKDILRFFSYPKIKNELK